MSGIRAKILSFEEQNIKMFQALPFASLDRDSIKKTIDQLQLEINQEINTALQAIKAGRNTIANVAKIEQCRKKEIELLKVDNALRPFLIASRAVEAGLKIFMDDDEWKIIEKLKKGTPEDLIKKMIQNGELLALYENDSKFFNLLFEQSVLIFKLYNQKPEAREVIKPEIRMLNTISFEEEVRHLLTALQVLDVPFQYICLLDTLKTRILEDCPEHDVDDKVLIVRHLIFSGELTKLIKNINEYMAMNQKLSQNFKYQSMSEKLLDESKETKSEAPAASALNVVKPSSESKSTPSLHSMWRRSQSSLSEASQLSSEPQVKKRKLGS